MYIDIKLYDVCFLFVLNSYTFNTHSRSIGGDFYVGFYAYVKLISWERVYCVLDHFINKFLFTLQMLFISMYNLH